MGESCVGTKVDHSISIEKLVWVLKGVNIQDFNNIKHIFSICFIPFKAMTLNFGVVCLVKASG